jgi:hypothetical protein
VGVLPSNGKPLSVHPEGLEQERSTSSINNATPEYWIYEELNPGDLDRNHHTLWCCGWLAGAQSEGLKYDSERAALLARIEALAVDLAFEKYMVRKLRADFTHGSKRGNR